MGPSKPPPTVADCREALVGSIGWALRVACNASSKLVVDRIDDYVNARVREQIGKGPYR